jgi:hypothetical protein
VRSFDWAKSPFSTFFNIKGVQNEAEFYDVWSKCVAPSLDATTAEYTVTKADERDGQQVETTSVATPEIPNGGREAQPPAAVPKTPNERKRSRSECRTPTIRPTKVVCKETPTTLETSRIEEDLDSAIDKAFVGMIVSRSVPSH